MELTDKDVVKNINIITLSNSPSESLYQILRQIYTPLLTEVQKNICSISKYIKCILIKYIKICLNFL